jgi:hypothetical protein
MQAERGWTKMMEERWNFWVMAQIPTIASLPQLATSLSLTMQNNPPKLRNVSGS